LSFEALSSPVVEFKSSASLKEWPNFDTRILIVYRAYSSAHSQTDLDLRWFRVAWSIGAERRDSLTTPCTSRPVFTMNTASHYIKYMRRLEGAAQDYEKELLVK